MAAGERPWPMPAPRGKDNYKWALDQRDLENGLSYVGNNERLRVVAEKLRKGEPVKVATIGGSITQGQGCPDAPGWSKWMANWLEDQFGSQVTVSNGAVGGTLSSYMSVCHNMHVPKDADLVFVEYSVNDWHAPTPLFENTIRRGFERLVRKLLLYPNRPAVVLMHAYIWFQPYPHEGAFWSNAERELSEFALYYHLPSLSLKSAVYEHMLEGDEGFLIDKPRDADVDGLRFKSFYFDAVHPQGNTGSRCMAELAMYLILKTVMDVEVNPVTDADRARVQRPLIRPLIPHNFQSISDKCFIGMHFTSIITSKDGFEWINESKTPRPKWGFVSHKPGSVLRMKLDTRAGASLSTSQHGGSAAHAAEGNVLVELAYLKSYEGMGRAEVACEGGCTCDPSVIEGHQSERNSLLHLHAFFVSQSAECTITVAVSSSTTSGGTKVKVAGAMVSEEAGQAEGVENNKAVEYVHDVSSRPDINATLFEVKNHVRRRQLLLSSILEQGLQGAAGLS